MYQLNELDGSRAGSTLFTRIRVPIIILLKVGKKIVKLQNLGSIVQSAIHLRKSLSPYLCLN